MDAADLVVTVEVFVDDYEVAEDILEGFKKVLGRWPVSAHIRELEVDAVNYDGES